MISVEKIEEKYTYYQDDVTGTTVAKIAPHDAITLSRKDCIGLPYASVGISKPNADQLIGKAKCNKNEDCFESELGKKIAAKKLTAKLTVNEIRHIDEAIKITRENLESLMNTRNKLLRRLNFCNTRYKKIIDEVVQKEDLLGTIKEK